jgi:hypothetical protein
MKWFHNNRYDIGRANIRDELIAIDNEVATIEREGLTDEGMDRLEAFIRKMERHKPEDSFLWD